MGSTLRIFALGGNEIAPTGMVDPITKKAINPDIPAQWRRSQDTCMMLAKIIKAMPNDKYILSHGNGPQVGNILLRAELANSSNTLHPLPLDVCGADTQGALGYMLGNLLGNSIRSLGIKKTVAPLVTQIVVDPNDPDFKDPSKFVGGSFTEAEAKAKMAKGEGNFKAYKKNEVGEMIWRKVVGSPKPQSIVEIDVIESVLSAGMVAIACGGGGIPVEKVSHNGKNFHTNYNVDYDGSSETAIYTGIEAVVDKDIASALLGVSLIERAKARGESLDAELAIITDEDGAKLNYQKPNQVDLRILTVREAEDLIAQKHFPAGSMGPKIQASVNFVKGGGKKAYITKVSLYEKTLLQEAGTTIVP